MRKKSKNNTSTKHNSSDITDDKNNKSYVEKSNIDGSIYAESEKSNQNNTTNHSISDSKKGTKERSKFNNFLRKKKKLLIVSSSILLVFFILFLIFGLQVKFILQEEMDLTLSPLEKSISATNDEIVTVDFHVNVKNPRVCSSVCSYELRDVSQGRVIRNETRYNLESDTVTYELPLEARGKGQKVFNMEVRCNNIRENLCSSSEKNYFKTAIITVDYDYSDDEAELRTNLFLRINETKALISKHHENVFILKEYMEYLDYADGKMFSEEVEVKQRVSEYESLFRNFNQLFTNLASYWTIDSYEDIDSIFESNEYARLEASVEEGNSYVNETRILIDGLNTTLANLKLNQTEKDLLNEAYAFYDIMNRTEDKSRVENYVFDFNQFVSRIENKDVNSIAQITNNAVIFESTKRAIIQNYNSDKEASYLDFLIMSNELLLIEELMLNANTEITDDDLYNLPALSVLYSDYEASENDAIELSGADNNISAICISNSQAYQRIRNSNQVAESYRNERYDFLGEELDTVNEMYANNSEALFFDDLSNFYEESNQLGLNDILFADITVPTLQNIPNFIQSSGYDNITLDQMVVFEGNNYATFNLSTINDYDSMHRIDVERLTHYDDSYCDFYNAFLADDSSSTDVFLFESIDINFVPMSSYSGSEYQQNVNSAFSLPKQENPQCCIFDNCTACCESGECDDNYPLIFLHGHAITKENTPERSHEAFALLQKRFEEEGYVNAGHISSDSVFYELPENEWGRFDAPITVRLSYYLLTYHDLGEYQVVTKKSDSIENYAIRLNEYIELVKFRTGKDKVDIVAHSMGGLVAREYMRIFGDESVNNLITVGTPNQGIEGRIKNLCSVTGASRECQEMAKDSIFLRRLNNPANEPLTANIYTIRAVGCDMDGKEGDGIVIADNVIIPYAENYVINGTCTDVLRSNLHTRMLSSNAYPETYRMIKEIVLK